MVDGVIYMSSCLEEETLDIINELDLKTVLAESRDKEGRLPSVIIDNVEAAYNLSLIHISRARVPVELVYFEVFEDKIEAMKREYAIKQLKRK